MMYTPPLSAAPDANEKKYGLIYLLLSLTVISLPIFAISGLLEEPLSDGQINFIYYAVNFTAVVWIFRRFLKENLQTALQRLFPTLYYAVLGYMGSQLLTQVLTNVFYMVFPDFLNVNDQSIYTMLLEDPALIVIGTVLLVPLAEECLYRGLIFRSLFDRRPILAYCVSMVAFASIHVAGYVGSCSAPLLLLCFLQYLPAAYCLCWCYRRAGTILCPILMHTLVNAVSMYYYVR